MATEKMGAMVDQSKQSGPDQMITTAAAGQMQASSSAAQQGGAPQMGQSKAEKSPVFSLRAIASM
jgi:hypothetical protein